MGYQLRRQLRETLGPGITGLQRAVALEIADDANEVTRESWAKLEDLARWTAAKDTAVVRNALKRLAAAGWEFRVPMGKGKDGRLLYAVPGKKLTFRVPSAKGEATATPSKGEPRHPPSEPRLPLGGAPAPSEGAPATPFSSSPQLISSPLSPAERIVRDSGLVAETERETFIAWINKQHDKPPGTGWWRTVARNGDLGAQVEEFRTRKKAPDDVLGDVARGRRVAIDACSRCDVNGLTDEDRPRRCDHQPTQEIPAESPGEPRPRPALVPSIGQPMPPAYGRQR